MIDPEVLRRHLDTVFHVAHDAGIVPLRLVEVADGRVGGRLQQFSVLFHGPSDRILPQGTYDMHHDSLGSLALFIVPVIGSTRERIVYEAAFSRPIS